MRRVIGIDIHRTFGEVVMWEDGRLRSFGQIDMTGTGLEGLGGELLRTDEVVIEATENCMAASRVLSPFVRRVELQAGWPQQKGNRRGAAYAYNVKALRDQELLAKRAEGNYARFVDRWRTRPPKGEARERLNPARNE